MPQVEITVSVEIPERPVSLVELEELAGEQTRRIGREIIARGIEASEPAVLAVAGGAKQRVKSRFVFTSFGEVRFCRQKVRGPDGYSYPLDRALGLTAWQTVSPTVVSTLSWLAAQLPFAVAAAVASRLWGVVVNPKRVWRVAQKSGERIRGLFAQGRGGPPPDLPAGEVRHEMVVVEADGTGLRCREGPTEVKLACWYAGREVIHDGRDPKGRRRRAFLRHKGVYASVESARPFAATARRLCERHVVLSRARYRLGVSDGGGWLPYTMRAGFGIVDHQLDHFHGRRRFLDTPGLPQRVAEVLWEWTRDGDHDGVDREIAWRVDHEDLEPEDARRLRDYLRAHRPRLHTARGLRRRGAPPELCTHWSGGVEHNVDLVVARRMKKKGMHWSRPGAANMLALRCVFLNPGAWEEVFKANP